MRTRVLRRPISFLCVRCSVLILLIKTVRCSIPHCVYICVCVCVHVFCVGLVSVCDCIAGVAITRLENIIVTARASYL